MKFFKNKILQIHIASLRVKRNANGDGRVTIGLWTALDAKLVNSAPDFVVNAWKSVRLGSATMVRLKCEIENVDADFYALPAGEGGAVIQLPRLTLTHLVVRQAKDLVVFQFQSEYSWDKTFWEWIGGKFLTDTWVKFDPAQAELVTIDDEEEAEGDDDQLKLGEKPASEKKKVN